MIKKIKKILIIGSAPDSITSSEWKNLSFDNINAVKLQKDHIFG